MIAKGERGEVGCLKRKKQGKKRNTAEGKDPWQRDEASSPELESQPRHLQAPNWGKLMENRGTAARVWPKGLFLLFLLVMHVLGLTCSFQNRHLSKHLVLTRSVNRTRAGTVTNRSLPAGSWEEAGVETVRCHGWFWFHIARIFFFSELHCPCSCGSTGQSSSLLSRHTHTHQRVSSLIPLLKQCKKH